MSSLNLQLIETIDTDKWEALIASSDTASFFQTKTCYDFYCAQSALSPFLYAVKQGEVLQALVCGYIVASKLFPFNYFSRRAIIPGGLLIRKNCSSHAIELLLNQVKEKLKQRAIYIEFRNFNDYSPWKESFHKIGFEYKAHYNVHNTLENLQPDTLIKTFAEEKQRQLKKATAHQITCEQVQNTSELLTFYKLLSAFYRKEVRLPLFPFDFFVNLQRLTNAVILVVKQNNQIVGGIVVVHDHQTAYEWFVCGKKDNPYYPSVVATAAGIQWTLAKGLKKFDFMGAGKTTEPSGIRNFKLRFGGELVEHGRFIYIRNKFLYLLGKQTIQLIRNH